MKLFKNNYFCNDDLDFINSLLKTNMPFSDVLNFISNKNNQKIINDINDKLNKGEILETFIGSYLNKEISNYLIPIMKIFPFNQSLDISLSFIKKNNNLKQEILKNITYPLIILCISILGIYFFDLYGLNIIISLLKTFSHDLLLFQIIRIIIRITIYILFIVLLIIGFLILYFAKGNNIILFYILLTKYFPQSLIHIYFTNEFVSLFTILLKKGYKTKDVIMMLKTLKHKKIASFLSYHLDEQLLNGQSLNDATNLKYFDHNFQRFLKIACISNDFIYYLETYLKISSDLFKRKIKKLTLYIQIGSYILIGIIIIFIYQVLFLPMQAISGF